MIDWMFIIILMFAFIFMLFSIVFEDKFWKTTFIVVDIFLWFLLAATVMEIEIPYTAYNATSGQLEDGYHVFTGKVGVYLPYFFAMFASIMIIFFVKVIFMDLVGSYEDYKGRFRRK